MKFTLSMFASIGLLAVVRVSTVCVSTNTQMPDAGPTMDSQLSGSDPESYTTNFYIASDMTAKEVIYGPPELVQAIQLTADQRSEAQQSVYDARVARVKASVRTLLTFSAVFSRRMTFVPFPSSWRML